MRLCKKKKKKKPDLINQSKARRHWPATNLMKDGGQAGGSEIGSRSVQLNYWLGYFYKVYFVPRRIPISASNSLKIRIPTMLYRDDGNRYCHQ